MIENIISAREHMHIKINAYVDAVLTGVDVSAHMTAAKDAMLTFEQLMLTTDRSIDADELFSVPERMNAFSRHPIREAFWGTPLSFDYIFAGNIPVYAGNSAVVVPKTTAP